MTKEALIKLLSDLTGEPARALAPDVYDSGEWAARGEVYGNGAPFVIVHDGGPLARFCNWDYMDVDAVQRLDLALERVGYFQEGCTNWYTGVYPLP